MRPIYFNGKFYAGGLNGVHRVADRLIREVDGLLAARAAADRRPATLFLPARHQWRPELQAIRVVEQADGHKQLWEQAKLPRRAADGFLVNLCNLAPIAHRNKLLMLHDAQFLFPDSSYPLRQRIGYKLLTPLMARTSRRVLTVSNYSRQMLDLLHVSEEQRTMVLYNGADHILEAAPDREILARLGLTQGGFVLLFGSHKRYKNVQVVFEAFAAGSLDQLDLVVIGPDRAELERGGLTVPGAVRFAGRAGDGELRALYENALCLAFPSRTEGFGLPPVEAMLCDCPSVVAPAGAIPEVCRDAALYADVDDPAGWAAMIRRYATDGALRRQKVESGRSRAACFTWAQAGRTLLETIEALA
jgi:glycosyltransferase involved in cell wall biosynthesis